MKLPVNGDYVLATKWRDGDPQDHWVVGFYDGFDGERHFVVDNKGNQFRGNGFRRARKIKPEYGTWLLNNTTNIMSSDRSLWSWLRHVQICGHVGGNIQTNTPSLREKVEIYEALLHDIQLNCAVVMNGEKVALLLDNINRWSYAHRSGEITAAERKQNINKAFWNLRRNKENND